MACDQEIIFCVSELIKFPIEILMFLVSNLAHLGPCGREVIFFISEPIKFSIEILTFLVSNLAHLGPCGLMAYILHVLTVKSQQSSFEARVLYCSYSNKKISTI